MTVMATSTKEFNVNQIVRMAYELAGLLNIYQLITEVQAAKGRDQLELIVDELQAKGIMARTRDFALVTLAVGTGSYQLSTTVLEVQGPAMYIPAGVANPNQADGESRVELVGQDAWHLFANKDAKGQPTIFWPKHTATVIEVRVLPLPSEAGFLRLPVTRLAFDVSDGNATLDADRPWARYFVCELAHFLCLANSQPLAKCQYYAGLAQQKFAECRGFSNQKHNVQFFVDHSYR